MSEQGTILVVDDTSSIRVLVGMIVRKMGFQTMEAGNGLEGMARLKELQARRQTPVLVVTDLYMPQMDGVTFIREIRKTDKTTPILMLTTESYPEKRQEGKAAGANAWMVKPIESERFATLVRRLTQK
ncbi:MAG: response regulator [Magnetococcales bacterium]|nr:response regulator [Magnetococcales bacterium]NGZ25668.1 response regulator [Magnetococcales bacterium]